jgi:aminopeptidase N
VPVLAQVQGNARVDAVVAGGKGRVVAPGCGVVVVNAGQAGYYRTLYGDAQFAAIRDGFATLPTIDQLGIMGDTWSLGMAGLRAASDYLDLATAVPVGADPTLWSDIAGHLGDLDGYYDGDDARQQRFRTFARGLLQPVFARVGWNEGRDEDAPMQLLRSQLIGTLAGLGDDAVIAEARRRFDLGTDDAMPPALRTLVTDIVAGHADAATWDRLHAMATAEKTPLIKDQLYTMLAVARDRALARRALELALTDEPAATTRADMIDAVSGEFPDMAFDFAVAHRAQVDALVDSTSRARYYPGIANGSADEAIIARLRDFADRYIAPTSRNATETVIAGVQYRIAVRRERLPQFDAWLQRHGD